MNIRDYIKKIGLYHPNRVCMVHNDVRLTAKELMERIFRVSNALLNMGLQKSDRAGVLLHNCHQCVECFYGIQCAGLAMVPLNARNSAKEHLYMLQNSGAKALFVGEEFADDIRSMQSELPGLEKIVLVGKSQQGFCNYEELLNGASACPPDVPIGEQEMSSIRYTSGTTGKPKGVIHTHRNNITTVFNVLTNPSFHITEEDAIALMGPVTHASGTMILPHVLCGAKVVILSRFDLEHVLETVQTERISTLYLVPTMIVMLINYPHLKKYDISSLKTIRYGASPISPDVLKRAIEVFGNVFVQGYGLTEGSMPVTILSKSDHILDGSEKSLRRLLSVGKETLVARVAIMGEDGSFMPPGEVGEIVIQSEQNMTGYWNNPQATEEAFRYGWMHTRDMGYRDEDGYIYLVDRKEDMIISGGFNIYPKEVEDVLYKHPEVLEAAVFGIPDEIWGESVKAAISLKNPGRSAPTADEIIEFCRAHLASYKKPKTVDFVSEIPKTTVGKINRRILKEPYWKERGRRV